MFTQMLPWLITAGTIGLVIGFMIGVSFGSALVRSHYTHILKGTQPQPTPKRAGRYSEDFY